MAVEKRHGGGERAGCPGNGCSEPRRKSAHGGSPQKNVARKRTEHCRGWSNVDSMLKCWKVQNFILGLVSPTRNIWGGSEKVAGGSGRGGEYNGVVFI